MEGMRTSYVPLIAALSLLTPAFAQPQGRGPRPPAVTSPEVTADHRVAFRIWAPQAQAVRMNASDLTGIGETISLKKATTGFGRR